MKKYLLLSVVLFLIVGCKEQSTSQNPLPIKIDTSSQKQLTKGAEKQAKIYPSIQTFIGKIGDQHEITLLLDLPKQPSGVDCQNITGTYSYNTINSPLKLKGELCLKKNTLRLDRLKEGKATEHFEGKLEGALELIKGTWTKGQQMLPFELEPIAQKPSYPLFVEALKKATNYTGEKVFTEAGQDEQGVYILEPRVEEYEFRSDYFYSTSYYESTAVNIDYDTRVFLMKSMLLGEYIAVDEHSIYRETFPDGKDSEEEPEYFYMETYRVYCYLNDTITNIFVEKSSEATTPIYAIIQEDKLFLVDKKTGKKEVLDQFLNSM